MRLEHRKEKLATIPIFIKRILRYFIFATGLIVFSTGIGTIGYHFIGELSWIDGFHMACMILTGMGPVAEMHSDEGKLFSSIYALYSGVAFLSVTAVLFAPFVHRLLHILHVEKEAPVE
jgi:hypothetical protein